MYTNILHATDLSNNHFQMCQKAAQIANKFGAKLYLLHVIETPTSVQIAQGLGFAEISIPLQIQEDAKIVLSALGESVNISISQQFVEIGSIKQHVINKCKELDCNLIIIGRHTPNHLPSCLDSTAHSIIDDIECDILTLT